MLRNIKLSLQFLDNPIPDIWRQLDCLRRAHFVPFIEHDQQKSPHAVLSFNRSHIHPHFPLRTVDLNGDGLRPDRRWNSLCFMHRGEQFQSQFVADHLEYVESGLATSKLEIAPRMLRDMDDVVIRAYQNAGWPVLLDDMLMCRSV